MVLPKGLCKAKKAAYISTMGGFASLPHLGEAYAKAVFNMYGVSDFYTVCAQGLDIWGADIESIMGKAKNEAEALGKAF